MQLRAARPVGLPLLLEDALQLRTGELDRDQSVRERLHIGDVAHGHGALGAEEQVGAQAARIHQADLRRGSGVRGVRGRPQVHICDQVTERGFDSAIGARGATAHDVGADPADLLGTDHRGLGDRVGDDLRHRRVSGVERRPTGDERLERRGDRLQLLRVGIHGDVELAEGGAVLVRLQHGARTARALDRARVRLVGVRGDDRIDLCRSAAHERAVVGAGCCERGAIRSGSSVVREQHDHIGAVCDLLGHAVRGRQFVTELDARDTRRGDHRSGVARHRADEADAHAVALLDVVFLQRGGLRAREVDVRTETELAPVEARRTEDAVGQIGEALVELVVADCADVESRRAQGLDRRSVVGDERGEGRGADVVARRSEDRVRVLCGECAYRAREYRGARLAVAEVRLDPAVEVVQREHLDISEVIVDLEQRRRSRDLVRHGQQRSSGGRLFGGNESQPLRSEVSGEGERGGLIGGACDRDREVAIVQIAHEGGFRGHGDVVDGDAADALEPDEGVGAPVHLADGETLGLGTLVVAATLEVRLGVVRVEEVRRCRGDDLLEVVSRVEHLCAVGRPDRERTAAEGVQLVVAAQFRVEPFLPRHVQAPERGVTGERRQIRAHGAQAVLREVLHPHGLHVAAPFAGVALVRGDQIGGSACRV